MFLTLKNEEKKKKDLNTSDRKPWNHVQMFC